MPKPQAPAAPLPIATNLRSLDLNLLTVFEAVFETGSITRAAERLALSQSATSHALSRLRDACRDDLFVRVGQGITPTPVAQRIYPAIRASLDGLRRSIQEARGFDPATSTRRFHIGIPHPMGPIWAIALRQSIAAIAPGVRLQFDTRTIPVEAADRMRAGELDMVVDWLLPADDRFVTKTLFNDGVVFIARGGHPRAKRRMDRKALRRESFVRVHERIGASDGITGIRQALRELELDWALSVSEFLEVPFLVMQTDLMGFITRTMVSSGMDTAGLLVIEGVMPDIPVPISLIWHETRRADPGHRWLRERVAEGIAHAAKA
jgi:DNA-binding transcriptional LysR family regulator